MPHKLHVHYYYFYYTVGPMIGYWHHHVVRLSVHPSALRLVFSVRFVAKRYILQQVSERTNRKLSARNTLVGLQLLALYTDHVSHNAQRHRQTDRQTDGQTDLRMMSIADNISK